MPSLLNAQSHNFADRLDQEYVQKMPPVYVSVDSLKLQIGDVVVHASRPRIENGNPVWDFDHPGMVFDGTYVIGGPYEPFRLSPETVEFLKQWVYYNVRRNRYADASDVAEIYARLHSAEIPHFGNDNISAVLQEGDVDVIENAVTKSMYRVLRDLVIDVDSDHNMRETARRHAKMLVRETFAGRYQQKPPVTVFPNVKKVDELIVVGPIVIHSACSHHLVPITGEAFIGILPGATSALPGLSKYERIAQWVAQRPQIQEEMAAQIADEIEKMTNCDGLALVIRAKHMCCSIRGVKNPNSMMRSSVMRGVFRTNPSAKAEFLSIIAGQ